MAEAAFSLIYGTYMLRVWFGIVLSHIQYSFSMLSQNLSISPDADGDKGYTCELVATDQEALVIYFTIPLEMDLEK
jgi:hypothetical protein